MVGNPAMSLHVEGETGTHYTVHSGKKEGMEGGCLRIFSLAKQCSL